jgi:Transposase domain (DUF772)
MNFILNDRLSQFMTNLQIDLWNWQQDDPLELTPKLIDVVKVLEFVNIEKFLPIRQGLVGRPAKYRSPIARAFVAKAVLDLPTTEALIDRLQSDLSLRRICGLEPLRCFGFLDFFAGFCRICAVRFTRYNA